MRSDTMAKPTAFTVRLGIAYLCALALMVVAGLGLSSANAAGLTGAENFIPQFSETGSTAGKLALPVGIATNPVTGDVYVADDENSRISEFTPWGGFMRAFGWGVADGASKELQTCTTNCFKGVPGAGSGGLINPDGLAVDAGGDLYVREYGDERVQKFTASGQFLLMFGGEVNKSQVQKREEQEAKAEPVTVTANEEDVCTAASGDQCGAGTEGQGPGQLTGTTGITSSNISIDPGGEVVIPGKERIEEFEPDGAYKSQLAFPGQTVQGLAVDPTNGDFYVTFAGEVNVHRLSPTGISLGIVAVPHPGPLAVDSTGNLFVTNGGEIAEFGPSGEKLSEFDEPTQRPGEASLFGLGTNAIGDIYVSNYSGSASPQISFVSAYGPAPVNYEPPPKIPPTIESEYTLSADQDSAVVQARINPHFWDDTTFYVQYGTGDCEAGGCVSQPAISGIKLTGSPVDASIVGSEVLLSGLQPDTIYHYRFVSEGGGGGPVFGPDRTFTTFPTLVANMNCPNQSLRTGFSALLSDCRGYEMVSPVDKDNGDILAIPDITGYEDGVDQSSTGGERFTYSSYRAFDEAKGAPYANQYIASRDPAKGWSTEAITAPQHLNARAQENDFENEYKLFSPDLSSAWLSLPAEPALAPGAVAGFRTLYRRDNVSNDFEALTTVTPPTTGPNDFGAELQGVSADGSRTVFRADDKLTPEASSEKGLYEGGIEQLYEADSVGNLHLVSMLPNGTASAQDSSAGSYNAFAGSYNHLSSVSHAISNDGSRVYWSQTDFYGAAGKIFLRENADQEQSALSGGECVEAEKACTVAVASKASQFWLANSDGSKALYTISEEGIHNDELDEFDAEEDASTPIAQKVLGVVGASEDLSYIYFVSTEALAPGATVGQPNLYLRHEEANSLIATLASADLTNSMSIITHEPDRHAARVTPDGGHLVFIATASLTGYDNTDPASGKPDAEVYMYDAGSERLDCLSCDRSGARPAGQEVSTTGNSGTLATAASIPGWENQLYASRVLSDDGSRVFFDSYVALVPRDTNGKEDVYEWEAAGSGDCDEQSPAFSATNDGCVSLISNGESPGDSEFMDASPSGSDVFFATGASLSPGDPGLIDVYDARVDGGFPEPAAPPASCEGEACEGLPVSPDDLTPASASFMGPGDLVSALPGAAGQKKTTSSKRSTSQIKAVQLSKALKACRARAKLKRRKSCEATARKRYGSRSKNLAGKSNKGGK